MLPELGQVALILALLVACLQGLLPLLGAQRNIPALVAVARPAAYLQLLLVGLAFAILTHGFVVQDFSMRYVAENSNSLLPLVYRYTAVWGAHEGSLLLWVLILAGWSALAGWWIGRVDSKTIAAGAGPTSAEGQLGHESVYAARVLGFLGLVSLAMLSFILLTSNPFTRLLPAMDEGQSLNPLLQDPGLAPYRSQRLSHR